MDFEQWKLKVNNIIKSLLRTDSDCIDELPYWELWNKKIDWYEVGVYSASRKYVVDQICNDPDYKFSYINTCFMESLAKTPFCKSIDLTIKDISNNLPPIK